MSSNNAGALRVSIVVPCRNERHYIDSFIDSVSAQLPVAGGCEIIIADGMSEDGTRELLDRRSAGTPALRWIDNPSKTVSHGLNLAVAAARGEIIIRMDVHTHYARDYVAECVRVLDATDADNVGGPWRATGGSYLQSAIAIAFNSPFAVGGARSHDVSFEGVVDSVYLGCWRRSRLIEIGLFDEELVRNQDDELNLRLTRCGGTVWQSPTIQSQYSPRASLRNLLKQYMQYGYWKVRVIQKHRMPASLRHVIPAGYVSALVLAVLAALLNRDLAIGVVVLVAPYLLATVTASVLACAARQRWKYLPVMPLVFACYHFGYAFGFLGGVWNFLVRGRRSHGAFESLTR